MAAASKRGMRTSSAPACRSSTAKPSGAAWYSGPVTRWGPAPSSPTPRPTAASAASWSATVDGPVRTTPFGRPVVPEVYSIEPPAGPSSGNGSSPAAASRPSSCVPDHHDLDVESGHRLGGHGRVGRLGDQQPGAGVVDDVARPRRRSGASSRREPDAGQHGRGVASRPARPGCRAAGPRVPPGADAGLRARRRPARVARSTSSPRVRRRVQVVEARRHRGPRRPGRAASRPHHVRRDRSPRSPPVGPGGPRARTRLSPWPEEDTGPRRSSPRCSPTPASPSPSSSASCITGSGSMLAESVHSVADSGNQALLLLGGRRAQRAPTAEHPFGYGRERYFWSFVVASSCSAWAACSPPTRASRRSATPTSSSRSTVAIVILLVAIVLEASRSAPPSSSPTKVKDPQASWWAFIRRSKKPELPVVLLEDLGALVGLVIALIADQRRPRHRRARCGTASARWPSACCSS